MLNTVSATKPATDAPFAAPGVGVWKNEGDPAAKPPETLVRRADKFWPVYTSLHLDDLIVLPLHAGQQVALAKVTGKYEYAVGENGSDVHRVSVEFYPEVVPFSKFKKHEELLVKAEGRITEVTDKTTRLLIREQLPHSYNRFVKFKWLLVIFFAMPVCSTPIIVGTLWPIAFMV